MTYRTLYEGGAVFLWIVEKPEPFWCLEEGLQFLTIRSSSERVAEEKPSEINSKYVIVVQCYNQSNHSIFTQINFSTSLWISRTNSGWMATECTVKLTLWSHEVKIKGSKQTGHVGASSTYLLCLSLDRVEPDYVKAPPDAVELASMAHHLTWRWDRDI